VNGGGDTKWYVLWIAYCFFIYFFFKFLFQCFNTTEIFFLNNTLIIFFSRDFHNQSFSRKISRHLLTTRSIENWKERIGKHSKPTDFLNFQGFFFSFFFLKFFIISSCCYNDYDFKLKSIVRVNHFLRVQTIHCTDK